MVIETINNQRVLTPENNMWLYNKNQKIISDKVFLGIKANKEDWTDTDKTEIVVELAITTGVEAVPNYVITEY